ncbi:MAG TPA: HXXEE domain-containing protein [Longimicrobium sp.]|nr:HXXEE domain-containing protein [Longimicrobium sp.]
MPLHESAALHESADHRAHLSRISQPAALLLVPTLLTIHNAEEALFMPAALRSLPGRVPAEFARVIPSYPQFLVALAIVTALAWVIWLLGRERHGGVVLLLLLQTVMLVNVVAHVGAAILLRGYAPGLVTALALNLPFSIYLLRRAVAEGWPTRRSLASLVIVAVLMHGQGIVWLMWIAGHIIGS